MLKPGKAGREGSHLDGPARARPRQHTITGSAVDSSGGGNFEVNIPLLSAGPGCEAFRQLRVRVAWLQVTVPTKQPTSAGLK